MKSLKSAVIVSAVLLSVSGLAFADSASRLNHNFMSKRAYQAPVVNSTASQADSQWEGATYRPSATDEGVATQNNRQIKQLRINSFARCSFVG